MSYRLSSLAEEDLVQHDVVLRRPERQPSHLIGEVKETEGFARKLEDVREADVRLANRLTRLSGSRRFGASSWSVGSIWDKSGPPQPALRDALEINALDRSPLSGSNHDHTPARTAMPRTMRNRRVDVCMADSNRVSD